MNSNLPKLALIGYGSMGHEIETIAKQQNIIITDIFEIDRTINPNANYHFDVALDFTFPNTVLENVQILGKLKKNIVLGTTGWYEKKFIISEIVNKYNIGLIYGSNFSIGMNMLFRLTELAGKMVNKLNDYDVMVHELHHHRKKDSPSGSALSIADIIIREIDRKKTMLTETAHERIEEDMLHVSSSRGGEITGTHTVFIDSAADTIELTHRAKNRKGFAAGAIEAAKWIHGRQGFYEFNVMLNNLLDI